MFSRIRPVKSQLKSNEYDRYRILCNDFYSYIIKHYGITSAKIIKDNFSFLALLENSFNDYENDDDKFVLSSEIAIILLYLDYEQCIQTSKGLRKLSLKHKRYCLTKQYKYIIENRPEIAEILISQNNKKKEMKSSKSIFIDKLAEPYAVIVSEIFSLIVKEKKQVENAKQFGYLLGRYLYISDIYSRVNKDYNEYRPNPLIIGNSAINDIDLNDITEKVNDRINFTLGSLSDVYVELKPLRNKAILDNIINISLKEEFYNIQSTVLLSVQS